MAVARLAPEPFGRERFEHGIDQFRALMIAPVVLLIGGLGPGIVGSQHQLEHVLPGLQLAAIFGRIGCGAVVFQQNSQRAGAGGHDAKNFVFDRAADWVRR